MKKKRKNIRERIIMMMMSVWNRENFSSPCALDHKRAKKGRRRQKNNANMKFFNYTRTSTHLFSTYPCWWIHHVLCCDHVPLLNTTFYRDSDSVALLRLATSSLFILLCEGIHNLIAVLFRLYFYVYIHHSNCQSQSIRHYCGYLYKWEAGYE